MRLDREQVAKEIILIRGGGGGGGVGAVADVADRDSLARTR